MRFDSHQQKTLAITLDSLLRYVNERYHVVRAEVGEDSHDQALRSQLVARYMWDHLDLIDDFVRENPDNLAKTYLDIAADLSGTLYGTLYLESYSEQEATIVHHTGVYTVASPNETYFGKFFNGPVELRGAIAPFRGIIVPIPPLFVMGNVSATNLVSIHESLSRQGTSNPTDDAEVLAKRARAWRATYNREQSHERPLPVQDGPCYHRGVLSGLGKPERERVLSAHADDLARNSGSFQRIMDTLSIEATSFPTSMEEALLNMDDDWISNTALELGDEPIPPALPTDKLVTWIRKRVQQDKEGLNLALTWCLDEQFDLLCRLMHTNPLPLDELAPSLASHLYPMIPYTFVFRCEGSLKAWMPPEVRELMTEADLEAIRDLRARLHEARMAARGLATMCGIISMAKVYERYRRAVAKPLSRRMFEAALEEYQDCSSRDDFSLWRHLSCDYIVSVEISDASAAARVVRERFAHNVVDNDAIPGGAQLVELSAEDDDEFLSRLVRVEKELEEARLSLLSSGRPALPPDLPSAMLATTPIRALMELPALEALRSFVEAHIPDGEDDYEFGEQFCRSIVVSATLMCESYNDTMDIIRLYDMQHCEGTDFSDTLGRLVTNAYNALPRWDLNGWSLEQNTERLTGRRRFFNEDGTLKALRDSDLCPCGSGRTYGHCCGNL